MLIFSTNNSSSACLCFNDMYVFFAFVFQNTGKITLFCLLCIFMSMQYFISAYILHIQSHQNVCTKSSITHKFCIFRMINTHSMQTQLHAGLFASFSSTPVLCECSPFTCQISELSRVEKVSTPVVLCVYIYMSTRT